MKKTKKTNIVGIIPARGGSKGVPKKNSRLVLGKPLISYTIEAAKMAHTLDRIIVSTDDDQIADIARQCEVEVVMRPSAMAEDTSPVDDALRHVVQYLQESEAYVADVIVFMQANLPYRKEGMIDDVVHKLLETNADSVVTVYGVTQRPEWMKIEKEGVLSPYSGESTAYRRQDVAKNLYLLDGAVLAMEREVLMAAADDRRVHSYLGKDIRFIEQEQNYAIEIDGPDDFQLAEYLLRSRSNNE